MKNLFIHIPKTAGQSVHAALGQKNGPHRPLRRYPKMRGRFVFTVVRNPYDRALSLFHWYRQLHLKPEKKRTPHNAAMNLVARGCQDANEFWTRFFPDGTLKYQRRYTPMMVHQLAFLVERGRPGEISKHFDRIIRFENLAEEWNQLREERGFKELPHVNRSVHLDWRTALNDEAKEVIARLYAIDFEVLGYEV